MLLQCSHHFPSLSHRPSLEQFIQHSRLRMCPPLYSGRTQYTNAFLLGVLRKHLMMDVGQQPSCGFSSPVSAIFSSLHSCISFWLENACAVTDSSRKVVDTGSRLAHKSPEMRAVFTALTVFQENIMGQPLLLMMEPL